MIVRTLDQEKPLEWIGNSHKDLMSLPADVRRLFGFALSLAQAGDKHDAAKVLKGFSRTRSQAGFTVTPAKSSATPFAVCKLRRCGPQPGMRP